MDIDCFSKELAQAISRYLVDNHNHFSKYEILGFDVGCFPWHGNFELSFRTIQDDPACKYDIADWALYAFNHEVLAPSSKLDELGMAMQSAYTASNNPPELAKRLINATAISVSSSLVKESLGQYNLGVGFEITVFHPDSGDHNNLCSVYS